MDFSFLLELLELKQNPVKKLENIIKIWVKQVEINRIDLGTVI